MAHQFSGQSLIDRIKARPDHAQILKAGDRVGVFACFDAKAAIESDGSNDDIVAVATTDDVDLDDEVVLPSGITIDYLNKNRKLFVDHKYESQYAVGFVRSMSPIMAGKTMRGWSLRARLYKGPMFPAAEMVREIIAQDGIGLSIGFIGDDVSAPTADEMKAYPGARSIVRKARVLEVSFTCFPANVSCQTMNGAMDREKAARIAPKVSDEARKLFSLGRPMFRIGST